MLMRHGELEDALRMYTGNIELKITDFELIQKITNILKGFKLITEKLSGSYATMGDLFILVKSLLLSLADSEDPIFSGIKSFRLTLRDDLKRRMDGLENNDIVAISTFLNPRFKEKHFSSKYICGEVRRKVADAVQNLDLEIRNVESDEVVPVSKHYKPSCGSGLIDIFAMLNESDDEEEDRQTNTPIVDSINQYVAEQRIPSDADPFAWWNMNKHRYVSLSKLARIFLSAPPTSVPSEQLFSSAGIIYEPTRNRLSGDKAEMLLFLKYNLCLLKFEY